jgi:hypothetical protein
MKVMKGCTKREAAATDFKLADCILMRTGSLFDHGNGASNATGRLKKAQQYAFAPNTLETE